MGVVGLGLGACNLASLTALNARVTPQRRALAVGLATCGTGAGTTVLPPIHAVLIASVGWRWALRIVGLAISAALFASAFQLRGVPRPARKAAAEETSRSCLTRLPCADLRFLLFFLNQLFVFFGYFAPISFLAEFAQHELAATAAEAAMLYTVMGVVALVVRALLGALVAAAGGPRRVHFASQ